jgi:hypothetical protein
MWLSNSFLLYSTSSCNMRLGGQLCHFMVALETNQQQNLKHRPRHETLLTSREILIWGLQPTSSLKF